MRASLDELRSNRFTMDPINMDEGRCRDGKYGQRIFVKAVKNNFCGDKLFKP